MTDRVGIVPFGNAAEIYHRMLLAFPGTLGESSDANLRQVHFSHDLENVDWLVVAHLTTEVLSTTIPRTRRILVTGGPSPAVDIGAGNANQFGVLISPYNIPGFTGTWVPSHGGLPWFFGRQTESLRRLEDLETLPVPEKTPTVSAVISTKVLHEGHRQRLRFVYRLQEAIGDRLHLYGRGIREVNDKADAILPHAYHLSLENVCEPNYWSEKISDAFLGYSLPLYAGCTNIENWFDPDSYVMLDLDDIDGSVKQVQQILDSDLYSQRLNAIRRSRETVLHQETLFHLIARTIVANPSGEPRMSAAETIRTKPERTVWQKVRKEFKRTYHRLTFRP
ncbi:glycosyltransferase family 10 domain-containing protein [Rhodopirellula bahusiensis]|uniref:glycosyltransferase family 10 domain-containing protein n=2 Tax=Rhodopirellula bahusiensis TaxID=2014065 RepID=UPI0032969490